ncbi:MAG: hypothetical protein JNJ45_03410 [Chthonomonas sp.]|nr:hypothetical protein [Chthonomonas sp.]
MIRNPNTLNATSTPRAREGVLTGSTSALLAWGMFNVFTTMLAQLFPILGISFDQLFKYQLASMAAWLVVGYSTRKIPFRVPVAITALIILQLWYCVTTLLGDYSVGRRYIIVITYYHVLLVVMCFLQAAAVVYLYPRARKIFTTSLIVLTTFSALVAIGQMAGVGPLVDLGNRILGFADIGSFAAEAGGTVRGIGAMQLGHGTTLYLVAAILIGGNLLYRNLKWYEVVLVPILLVAAFLPQVRVLLLGIGVTMIMLLVMLIRRMKANSTPVIILSTGFLAAFFYFGRDKLQYLFSLFSGDSDTFTYRNNYLWSQARNVLSERPMFGIGLEPGFAGLPSFRDRYVGMGTMDGGFHFAAACGGLPAVVLLIIFASTATLSIVTHAWRGSTVPERRIYLLALVPIGVNLIPHMYMGNYFVNPSTSMLYFVLAGLAMSSESEHMEHVRGNLRERYGDTRRFSVVAAKFPHQEKALASESEASTQP